MHGRLISGSARNQNRLIVQVGTADLVAVILRCERSEPRRM